METIYIYNGASRLTIPVTDSAERSHSLQQHNYVKLVWKSAENTPISANAYIEYEGQVFYALDDYFPTHKDGIYEYDIEFHAIEDTFNRPLFFRYVDILDQTTGKTTSWKEIEWSLNGNLRTIAEIVVDSLNRAYDNAYFALPNDSYADTLLMSYSFSGNSIADALSTIAEQNETEWWLETTTEYVDGKRKYILHFDKCEIGTTIELNDHYTEDNDGVWQSGGLKSVSQSGNTNIIPQKLYIYGSERNIIKKTVEEETEGGKMNVSYDKKLRLPSTFPNGTKEHVIESAGVTLSLNDDSSISIGGINNHFEKVKIFDEVYPKMDMEVTAVSVQNPNSENPIYWLKGDRLKSITTESPVDGSINPGKLGLLIEGCTLMCTFTSGLLNGREFECSWRESSAEIGLIPIDENDVQIPSGVFKPQEGDTFILWNLAMPQSSITIAQNELCVEAINYIEELVTSITETDCTTEAEATRISSLNTKIKVGQRISVNSNVFRNGRLSSRIIKYSYKLTTPYDVNFTLASSRQTGRLATLENMIADVTHEVHATGQVQRAISRRQWHDTEEMMSMLDSIQKQMVVVGDENNAFGTTCSLKYNSDTKQLLVSEGYVLHQSFTDNDFNGQWNIDSFTRDMSAIDPDGKTPFYVFFVCPKSKETAEKGYTDVASALPTYDDYYVFILGILSSEFEGKRAFNQTNGITSIAGGNVTTNVIQDPDQRLIIDFANATITARNGATIKGAIQFEKGEGENDLGTALDDLFNGIGYVEDRVDNFKASGLNMIGRVSFKNDTINGSIADEKLYGEDVYLIEQDGTMSSWVTYEFDKPLKGGIPYVLSFYSKTENDGWIKVLILSLDDEPIYNTNIPLSVDVWGQTYSEVWIDGDIDGFKLKLAFIDTFNTYISCLKLQTGNIPTEGFEATLVDVQEAKEKADNAGKDATEAKNRLNNWASDSVISPTEKQGIKDEIARIVADKSHIESEYTKYSLGTPTTFNTAYTNYYNVLTTLSATTPETIKIPTDFATKQTNYYTERTNALNAISKGAKLYAESYADYVSEYEKLKGVNLCSYKKILDSGLTYAIELQNDGSFKIKHSTLHNETTNPNNKDMFGMEGEYLENTQYTFTLHNITNNATTGTTLYFIVQYSDGTTRDDITTPYDSKTFSFTTRKNKTILKIRGTYSYGGYTIAQFKLEVGDTATPYTISPDDREYIVDNELTEITDLQSDFQESLNAINSDEYFSISEKKIIRTDWEAISGINSTSENNSYTTLSGSYGEAYQLANGKVSTQDLTDKFSALRLFLHNQGTKGLYVDEDWNWGANGRKDMSDRFTAYYNAEVALLQAYNDYFAKKQVQDLQIGGVNLISNIPSKWEQGSFTESKALGTDYSEVCNYVSSTRIRVKNAIEVKGNIYIKIHNSGYDAAFIQFDEYKKYLGRETFITWHNDAPHTLHNDTRYICLILRKSDNTTITPSDITNVKIQLELGNKATAWKPNDADIIEARENILEDAMVLDLSIATSAYSGVRYYPPSSTITGDIRHLTEELKPNTEYVFSIENIVLKQGSATPEYISIIILNSSNNYLKSCHIPYTDKKLVGYFTTPNSLPSGYYVQIYTGYAGQTTGVGYTAFGVKLAEGTVYTGWEATPSEQQALQALTKAMKGSTDIIGGLMLTNLIGMRDTNNQIKAGISGLNENNNLRFWAGSTAWSNANTAPFRVYDDGRVFGKLFYASQQSLTLNSSHITTNANSEYFSYDNGVYRLNTDNIPDTIYLNSTLANYSIGLPKKYSKDKTIEIYNPHKLALSFLDIVPNPTYCNMNNFRNNSWHPKTNASSIMPIVSSLSIQGNVNGYMSYNIGVKDTSATNYKPTYIKLKNIKVTLYGQVERLTISNTTSYYYVMYIPTWVYNNLLVNGIPNGVSYGYVSLGTSTSYTHYRCTKYIGANLPTSNSSFSLDFRVWIVESMSDDYLTDKVNY